MLEPREVLHRPWLREDTHPQTHVLHRTPDFSGERGGPDCAQPSRTQSGDKETVSQPAPQDWSVKSDHEDIERLKLTRASSGPGDYGWQIDVEPWTKACSQLG